MDSVTDGPPTVSDFGALAPMTYNRQLGPVSRMMALLTSRMESKEVTPAVRPFGAREAQPEDYRTLPSEYDPTKVVWSTMPMEPLIIPRTTEHSAAPRG